jgi:cardiolipin synthase
MVIDGSWVTIGSANLDPRSFGLNAELNVVIYNHAVAERMQQVFAEDLARSRPIRYVRWRVRPFWRRLLEVIALPFHNAL